MVLQCFLHYFLQEQIEENGREKASLSDANCCLELCSSLVVQENCTTGPFVEGLYGLDEPFLYTEASENVPQTIMPHPVECLFKVNEIVVQIPLVL